MPVDHAQSKGLRRILPVEAYTLRNFVALPIIQPRAPRGVSMPTRRTVILLPAAVGAAVAPLALTLGASADASALAFVADIYNAYKGKEAKGRPARRRARHPPRLRTLARGTDGQRPEARRQTR